MRAQGQQLIAMDTENCPPIDRARVGSRSSPASVEEIVAGMRSAVPYGTAAASACGGKRRRHQAANHRARATGGGMSVGGPPSGMSIR
jgi:hypothetical protein